MSRNPNSALRRARVTSRGPAKRRARGNGPVFFPGEPVRRANRAGAVHDASAGQDLDDRVAAPFRAPVIRLTGIRAGLTFLTPPPNVTYSRLPLCGSSTSWPL